MNNTTKATKRPRVVRISLIIIGLVTLIYLLSNGYAYRLIRTGKMSFETYNAAYGPFIWLEDHNTYFGGLAEWYQNLWYSDLTEWKHFIEQASGNSVNTNQATEKNK